MRYKYIVDVLRKAIRRIEMIDHSLERKFYGACYYRLLKFAPGQSLTIFYKFIIYKMHDNSKT